MLGWNSLDFVLASLASRRPRPRPRRAWPHTLRVAALLWTFLSGFPPPDAVVVVAVVLVVDVVVVVAAAAVIRSTWRLG